MMSNDISALPPPVLATRAPAAAAVAVERKPDAIDAKLPKAELNLPVRPHIQYDAEELRKNLQDAIHQLNEQVQKNQQNLAFSIDEAADRFVIKVKNTQTGEVVRQIPDDVVLKIAHNINDLKGLLHNKTI